jgi:hypothetical protein
MNEAQQQTPNQKESKTLKASGWAYLLGDAAGVAAGVARGKGLGSIAGYSTWFAGGVAAARYANPKTEILLRQEALKLRDYLEAQGVKIPDGEAQQQALLKSPSFAEKIENFLFKHPSEALNSMFGLGALGFLHEGIGQIKSKEADLFPKAFNKQALGRVSNKAWMGGLILAGALGGLLIKENKDAPEEAKNGSILEKAWAFIKEKPLRLTAALYGVNNIFTINDAYSDYRGFKSGAKYQNKLLKPHYFSAAVAASYLFANSMLSLSKRDQGSEHSFTPQQVAELETAAASVLAGQPPEAQAKLLQGVSEFLAKEKNINIPPEQLAQDMADRIAEITKDRLDGAVSETGFAAKERARRMQMPIDMQGTQAETAPIR